MTNSDPITLAVQEALHPKAVVDQEDRISIHGPTDLEPTRYQRGWTQVTMTAAEHFHVPVSRPILVVGASGGAGTTAVTIGLASAMAVEHDHSHPIAVDATPAGGNLALRGADAIAPVATLQSWLSTPEPSLPSQVDAACGRSSVGAGYLSRHDGGLPRRETSSSVHRYLADAGAIPVYDGGAPISARFVHPLLSDPRIPIALVVESSSGSVNQLTPVLEWLDREFGEYLCSEVAIVVVHRYPVGSDDASDHLRKYLGRWVRGVYDIPHDFHIAAGGQISWDLLHEETQHSFRNLLQEFR